MFRLNLLSWTCAAFVTAAVPAAHAQNAPAYPAKSIELVVPFAAGGSADVIARMLAQIVSGQWGQSIVVLNKAGATGAIGSEYVARAPADGYTLLAASASTHSVLPAFRHDLPYDTVTSFAPVTLFATFPNMLVVNPKKVPAKNVTEFIAILKASPGKLNYASSGQGSSLHFTAELFKLLSHTDMAHVPYRGSSLALTDLLAGNVDCVFDNMSTVWPQVQQGNLVTLGVTSAQRTPLAPQVPAIAETLPDFDASSWLGLVAPAGTPPEIVQKISKDFGAAVRRPDIVKRLEELGAAPASNQPAEFRQFIVDDRTRWERVAREAHLSAK